MPDIKNNTYEITPKKEIRKKKSNEKDFFWSL